MIQESPIVSEIRDIGYKQLIPSVYREYIHTLYAEFWGKDNVLCMAIHPTRKSVISINDAMNIAGYKDHKLNKFIQFVRNAFDSDLIADGFTIIYSTQHYHTISFEFPLNQTLLTMAKALRQTRLRISPTFDVSSAIVLAQVLYGLVACFKSIRNNRAIFHIADIHVQEFNSYLRVPLTNYELSFLSAFHDNPACGMSLTVEAYNTLSEKLLQNADLLLGELT